MAALEGFLQGKRTIRLLEPLTPEHVYASLQLCRELHPLKKMWIALNTPCVLQAGYVRHAGALVAVRDPDMLSLEEVTRCCALLWLEWGVLTEETACHCVTLLALGCNYLFLGEVSTERRQALDALIETLPGVVRVPEWGSVPTEPEGLASFRRKLEQKIGNLRETMKLLDTPSERRKIQEMIEPAEAQLEAAKVAPVTQVERARRIYDLLNSQYGAKADECLSYLPRGASWAQALQIALC